MRIPEEPAKDDDFKIFNNRIDHFNTHDSTTYKQRYLENLSLVKGDKFNKVVLYIGGEGTLGASAVVRGSHMDLAALEGAAVFALEHRFFGKSMPFTELTPANYKYLTIDQALADLAEFIQQVIHKHEKADAKNLKLVVVGGSYPGALSSWFRLKYPHLAVASWASSAPVNIKNDFPEYDQYVAEQVNKSAPHCLERTKYVFDLADKAVRSGDQQQIDAFKDKYHIQHETNDKSALYILADVLSAIIQYNSRYQLLDNYCAKLENVTSQDKYEEVYIETYQKLLDIRGEKPEAFDLLQATSTDPNSNTANSRSWSYMTCNEVGWFQTSSNGVLRSTLLDLDYFSMVCQKLFDIGLCDDNEVNMRYGTNNPDQTRIFFSNGDVDPWSTLGVHDANEAIQRKAIVIPGESHCADLGIYNTSLDSNLTIAQSRIIDSMHNWMNMRTDCVNGIPLDGECACRQGWTGETCDQIAALKSSLDIAIIVGISVPVVAIVVIIFSSWIFVYIPRKKQAQSLLSAADYTNN